MQTTSVMDLPPGTLIGERYKLLKSIGQGGFGITYIAWDKKELCQVAVKECFPQGVCVRDPHSGIVVPMRDSYEQRYLKAIESMRREIRTLSGLKHESIVPIHDVVWGNGGVYCVMPWLPGGTLQEMIDTKRKSITPEQAMTWLRSLLEALRYLHERSITHRDIKPSNIMFDAQQRPVIIDFGAALNRAERTATTTTSQGAFSRNYAAPEQITGKGRVGAWTDFYSLSATWYELITGIPPEAADARLAKDDMKPLAKQAAKLKYPMEVLSLLDCNMSLRANRRCQSVEQWLQCWEEGTLPQIVNPVMRYRKLLSISLALVLLGSGSLYGVYSAIRGKEPASGKEGLYQSAELKEDLIKYVKEEIRMQDYVDLCAKYQDIITRTGEEHSRQIDRFVAEFSAAIDRVEQFNEAEKLSMDLHDDQERLDKLFIEDNEKLRERFYQEEKAFPHDILKSVKPRNLGEELMMPAVSQQISYEMEQQAISVHTRCAEMPERMNLTNEYLKLSRKLEEKTARLYKEEYERSKKEENQKIEQKA